MEQTMVLFDHLKTRASAVCWYGPDWSTQVCLLCLAIHVCIFLINYSNATKLFSKQ